MNTLSCSLVSNGIVFADPGQMEAEVPDESILIQRLRESRLDHILPSRMTPDISFVLRFRDASIRLVEARDDAGRWIVANRVKEDEQGIVNWSAKTPLILPGTLPYPTAKQKLLKKALRDEAISFPYGEASTIRVDSLNWDKLPVELRYLAPAAEKYGHLQFDEHISDYLHYDALPDEIRELERLNVVIERDARLISRWLHEYSICADNEARRVYFLDYLIRAGHDMGRLC
jgi:hypothetical protein